MAVPARAGLFIAAVLVLGGCAGPSLGGREADDSEINVYPTNYKSDILAGMHAYLNDPTGIRDAAIAQPMLKSVGAAAHYIVCLRFDGKQDDGTYAGDKQIAAVFLAGRLDDYIDAAAAREPCAAVAYAPFPELERLKR